MACGTVDSACAKRKEKKEEKTKTKQLSSRPKSKLYNTVRDTMQHPRPQPNKDFFKTLTATHGMTHFTPQNNL